MTRDPITVTPDDTLARTLHLTRTHRIRHLPVVNAHRRLSGILSDRDIRLARPSPVSLGDSGQTEFLDRTPVAAIMTREVITAGGLDPIEDAAQTMHQHRIGSLPVVDAEERLVGILTETDVLRALVQILGGMEPSSRIEIALPDRPGQLGRAIRILGEELQLNIVSLVVPSLSAGNRPKTAIVHIATIDPREALAALQSAGFEIGWPSLAGDLYSEEVER